jgi:hypothetical protein
MLSVEELNRIIAPTAFKAADKFFKFASWLIIIVAIRYAESMTNEPALRALDWISTFTWGIALILQAVYLVVRDPYNLGVPPEYSNISRAVQFIAGTIVAFTLVSPVLCVDQIVGGLAKVHVVARTK